MSRPWIEIIDPPLVVHAISGAYKANWPSIHGNTWYRNVLNAIVEWDFLRFSYFFLFYLLSPGNFQHGIFHCRAAADALMVNSVNSRPIGAWNNRFRLKTGWWLQEKPCRNNLTVSTSLSQQICLARIIDLRQLWRKVLHHQPEKCCESPPFESTSLGWYCWSRRSQPSTIPR